MKLIKIIIVLAIIFSNMAVLAEEDEINEILNAENFSANISLTTNYIYHGETQSNNNPAVQGGFDWGYGSFYLGVWGSNVDFDSGDSIEIDYYGGYAGESGPISYDLGVFYYTYPGADDEGFEFDYVEIIPSLSYTFDTILDPNIYINFGYSPNYFGEEGAGKNIETGLSLSFANFGIDAAIGNQWVDGDNSGGDIKWLYFNIGVTTSVMGFDADLRLHAAREKGIAWLANDSFPNDEYVNFSVSRSF